MWYNIYVIGKGLQKGIDTMDWNELNVTFNKHYPDYEIIVRPPCISPTREVEYIMKAKAIVLGLIDNDSTVIVDHNNKKVYYSR